MWWFPTVIPTSEVEAERSDIQSYLQLHSLRMSWDTRNLISKEVAIAWPLMTLLYSEISVLLCHQQRRSLLQRFTDNKQRETLEHSNPICLHKFLPLGLRQWCGRGGGNRAVEDIRAWHRQLTEAEAVSTGHAESAPGWGLELGLEVGTYLHS